MQINNNVTKMDLAGLTTYLQEKGVKTEEYNIGELFAQVDKYDEEGNEISNESKQGDGFLNRQELRNFLELIKENINTLYETIKEYGKRFYYISEDNEEIKIENFEAKVDNTKTTPVLSESDLKFKNGLSFNYNPQALEDYIINCAVDHHGKKITYFSRIPEIRNIPEEERSEHDKNLLNEFDTMIAIIEKTAEDYDVDPRKIVAIIQRETGFGGTNTDADGNVRKGVSNRKHAGCGYMQLDSIIVTDILLGHRKPGTYIDTYSVNGINTARYGNELKELLESRGFNVNCSAKDKKQEYEKIRNYIMQNEDIDFNIRLGTLYLRLHDKAAHGNFRRTVLKYNGGGDPNYGQVNTYYENMIKKEKEYN